MAVLASLAVPQVRARLAVVLARASKVRHRLPGVGNSDAHSPSDDSRNTSTTASSDLTKEELRRAQEADIPGRSEMSKEQLVDALRARS